MTQQFPDRVRFNWGFWEGRDDAERNRAPLWQLNGGRSPDATYQAGYALGRDPAHARDASSDAAWSVHRKATEQRRAARRSVPSPWERRY
jgi:hypothetical protein